MALVAVRRRQCVISAATAGSSAAAMFPLFITHDEYFVRCRGATATKTPAATAIAGALPTINNQLKAAAAMVMETMTTMTNKT